MSGGEQGEYRTREEQKTSGYRPEERVSVIHQEDGHSYHYKVVDSADSMKKVRLCLFLVAVFTLCSCSREVCACVRLCFCVSGFDYVSVSDNVCL